MRMSRPLLRLFLGSLFVFTLCTATTPQALAAKPTKTQKLSAKPQAESTSLLPEVLGPKTLLEDLLVRRYSQELATTIDRQSFTMSSQLELVQVPKVVAKEPRDPQEALDEKGNPPDLLLGTLDPEELLRRYADPETMTDYQGLLQNYRIRGVSISIGLKEDLSPEAKTQSEKWLTTRLESEFSKLGHGSVRFIRMPLEKKVQKTFWDWLNQFQALAGQIVLAFAILLGALLWKLLGSRDAVEQTQVGGSAGASPSVASGASASASPGVSQASGGAGSSWAPAWNSDGGGIAAPSAGSPEGRSNSSNGSLSENESQLAVKEVRQLKRQLTTLIPKLSGHFEKIVTTWCLAGEEGMLKLACFAEAAGNEVGKLPVPVDAIRELSQVFSKMHETSLREKRDALRKVYWDLLQAVNIGADTLEQPFGYVGAMNIGVVNQALMEHNPKMKTLVALHMPPSLRESYLRSLSTENKRALLIAAAEMSEIPTDELQSLDGSFKTQVRPAGRRQVVSLDMSLNKIVNSLSLSEQIRLMSEMNGGAFDMYKRTTPSLAFMAEWPDDVLSLLLSRALPDELVALLRVYPAMKDRALSLSTEMMAELATDELKIEDRMSTQDKEKHLSNLNARLLEMVKNKEILLEEIFTEKAGWGLAAVPEEIKVEEIKEDDGKEAA